MARTTAAEVNAILKTAVATATVDAFIKTATTVVDEVLGSDTTLSNDLKEEIECWLTAHFISCTVKPQVAEAGGGPAPKVTFTGKTDMGLNSTHYGQQVMLLDTTGKMRAFSQSRSVNLYAVKTSDTR